MSKRKKGAGAAEAPARRMSSRDGIGKGIYILPNLITSGSLFAGFFAMSATAAGRYEDAATAIIAGVILDGLDGRVARMTNTTTKFGVEYDSLADLVSFGVAPAFLVHQWALSSFGRWGFLASFLYLICGALRLARFNVQVNTVEKGKFNGLPIPAAATFVASLILFLYWLDKVGIGKHLIVLMTIYVLAFLMVSTVKYVSFKDLEPFRRRPFNSLVALIFMVLLLATYPQAMIFALIAAYVVAGPIAYFWSLARKGRTASKTTESEKPSHVNDAH